MRQEVASRRLKNSEGAASRKKDGREDQQRPAIANSHLQKIAILECQKKSLNGRSPAC
jgi:hypothetical protein